MDRLRTAAVTLTLFVFLGQCALTAGQSQRRPTLSPSQAIQLRRGDPGGRSLTEVRGGMIPSIRGNKRITNPSDLMQKPSRPMEIQGPSKPSDIPELSTIAVTVNLPESTTPSTTTTLADPGMSPEKTLSELTSMINKLKVLETKLKRITQKVSLPPRESKVQVIAPSDHSPTVPSSMLDITGSPSQPMFWPTTEAPISSSPDATFGPAPGRIYPPVPGNFVPSFQGSPMSLRNGDQNNNAVRHPGSQWNVPSTLSQQSSSMSSPLMPGSSTSTSQQMQQFQSTPYLQQPTATGPQFGTPMSQPSFFQPYPPQQPVPGMNNQPQNSPPSYDPSQNILNDMLLLSTLGGNNRLGAATRESEFMNAFMFMNVMHSDPGNSGQALTGAGNSNAPAVDPMSPFLFTMAMGAAGNNNRPFDTERFAESLFRM